MSKKPSPSKQVSDGRQPRAPVVTVMGHIDHGKTTLLDKIRRANVVGKEAGGITQSIGAYQVEFTPKNSKKKEKITFIDTPGHAAFSRMRVRGTKVTDLAVLVVAADEGVKPQTKECVSHIKEAKIPFVVAINKIDLPGVLIDKVKGELADSGVVTEDFGGQVPVVSVSAKTGKGIDELLEMIILMAKIMDLKADYNGEFSGTVIESFADKKRGISATVLVQEGILRSRDKIYFGKEEVKVRVMFDENNRPILTAEPSTPVQVLGFKSIVPAGSMLKGKPFSLDKKLGLQKEEKKDDDPFAALTVSEEEAKELPVIIKVDTQGSLEAIISNLPQEVKIVYGGVGEVSDADVFLAQSGETQIFAFNVPVSPGAQRVTNDSGVVVRSYKVIYDLFDEIEGQVLKLMEPTIDRDVLGKVEILKEFLFGEEGRIAGCRVTEGVMNKNSEIHLVRKNEDLGIVRVGSMKHGKDDIDKLSAPGELGIIFSGKLDFKVGDVLISYKRDK